MRRFIADIHGGTVVLDDERRRHAKVIRLELQEKIEVVTRQGDVYEARVGSLEPLTLVDLVKREGFSRELPFQLVLIAPLLKGDKFDFILQKATELGVSSIVPYMSSRTVVRLSTADFIKKRPRFLKIIEEAVEQSNRDSIPILDELHSFKALTTLPFDRAFLAYEGESLKPSLIPGDYRPRCGERVAVLIGPEGGFSLDEVELLKEARYQLVSLGKRILKAETAVIYALSVLSYKGEMI